jgi:hypothetical protein
MGRRRGRPSVPLTRCFGWVKNDKLDESGVRKGLFSDKQRTQVCREGVGVGLLWVPVKVEKPQPVHMLLRRETDAEGWGVGRGRGVVGERDGEWRGGRHQSKRVTWVQPRVRGLCTWMGCYPGR